MGKSNALSRHTDHKEGIEHDNEDVILLKPEYFKVHADTTATRLGMILRNSVESSVIHSLILKHFETFYYNLM